MLRRVLRGLGLAALACGLAAAPARALDCFAICDINTPCSTSCFNSPNWITCGAYNSLNCGGGDGGPRCTWNALPPQDVSREVTNVYYIGNIDGTDYWGCSLQILYRQWEQNSCYGDLRGQCFWRWEDVAVTGSASNCSAHALNSGLSCSP